MIIPVTEKRLKDFKAICKKCGIEYSDEEAKHVCFNFLNYLGHLEEFAQEEKHKGILS